MTRAKRPVTVQRTTSDHEFKITVRQLFGGIAAVVTLAGGIPIWWSISDHWMNRQEIVKAMQDHADHDDGVQQWTQFGLAANRVEYLEDKVAECMAKRMVKPKLAPDESEMCGRYEAKLKSKQTEASALKDKALETVKEKRSK